MKYRRRQFAKAALATLAGIGTLTLLAACAPGSTASSGAASSTPVSTDVSSAGKVTLHILDSNTDGGIADATVAINKAFEKKYPNVTIDRKAISFDDMKTSMKLTLSSNDAPDVVHANQGYPDMGAYVSAGLLAPLNDYAKAYGWDDRYSDELLGLNSFSSNGKTWDGGNLYGVSQTGSIVGFYYNKSMLQQLGVDVPTTFDEFQEDLAKAKAADMQPIIYGDSDKSAGIQLYGVIQSQVAGAKAANDLVFAKGGKWTDDANVKAAQTLSDWMTKGYLSSDALGQSSDQALDQFVAGKGLFFMSGTWSQGQLSTQMKNNVGFTILSSSANDGVASTGGEGIAWAITAKSKVKDVAAAYLNYITSTEAAQILIDTGNLPANPPSDWTPEAGSLAADTASAWNAINKSNGIVPYLDYTTSTFYDTLSGGVQLLLADKDTPTTFTKSLQDDYSSFLSSR